MNRENGLLLRFPAGKNAVENFPQICAAMNPPEEKPNPHFVTCPCEHCGTKLEFDANYFGEDETRTVECPQCHQQTLIAIPQVQQIPPIIPPMAQEAKEIPERVLPPTIIRLPLINTADAPLLFIGQDRVKTRLTLAFEAASRRGESAPHTILAGGDGAGLTYFAAVIAAASASKTSGHSAFLTNGSVLKNSYELAITFAHLDVHDVLVIDRIDQIPKNVIEPLRRALQHSFLDIVFDERQSRREARINLTPFTVIATTTQKQRISAALLASFPVAENMDAYSVGDLASIAKRFAEELQLEIQDSVAEQIARSGCETPKDVSNRLRHIRDYAQVKVVTKEITTGVVAEALKMLELRENSGEAAEGRLAIPTEVRREVWRRDQGKCVKCGSRLKLEFDHIIPVAEGGGSTVRNIELLCEDCNRAKSDSIQ